MKYNLIPWHEYDIIDNGAVAPKGSNPKFVTDYTNMKHDENPKHPNVIGFVMHDFQTGMDVVPKKMVNINLIKIE
jgi:hypothetical protein